MTFLAPEDSSTIKTLTISPCLFFITVWDVAKIKNTWKAFGSLFDAGSLFVLSTSPLKLENGARYGMGNTHCHVRVRGREDEGVREMYSVVVISEAGIA